MRLFLCALFATVLLAGCGRNPLYTQESYVFGTRIEVLVWGEDTDKARAAVGEVLREFDRLHRAYHAWQPSELTAVNEAVAAGRSVEVSEELAQLITEARDLAAQSDHLFDPGIGRLVALWGFHDENFTPRLPDPARLAALATARPSIADVRVVGRSVTSPNKAVALDFGGYLKGVALDRAAAILIGKDVRNALVNIGGNVMALGSKGERPWRVGIQHPRQTTPLASLDLLDGEAIGTSGDYQRYFEIEGRRYSHLIDPRHARPADGSQAATVLIPPGPRAGLWSDVASKPLFVAGNDWRAVATRLHLTHVLRIDADGRIDLTEALARRLKFQGKEIVSAAPP